jgi:hypothetical protein
MGKPPLAKRLNLETGGITEILWTQEEVDESCKKRINPIELEQWKRALDELFSEGRVKDLLKLAPWRVRLSGLVDFARRMVQ